MVGPGKKKENRDKYRGRKGKDGVALLPQKRFYRQRAHANPFSDHTLE